MGPSTMSATAVPLFRRTDWDQSSRRSPPHGGPDHCWSCCSRLTAKCTIARMGFAGWPRDDEPSLLEFNTCTTPRGPSGVWHFATELTSAGSEHGGQGTNGGQRIVACLRSELSESESLSVSSDADLHPRPRASSGPRAGERTRRRRASESTNLPLAGPASAQDRPGGLRKRRGMSIPRTKVRRKATQSYRKATRVAGGRVRGGAAPRRILTFRSVHLWRVQPAARTALVCSERGGGARFA